MKAAVTVWDGRVSPVFDVSREALIVTIENGALVGQDHASLDTQTAALKVERLVQLEIDTLICGAISEPLHRELAARGIRVLGFVAGPIDEVLRTFVAGALPTAQLSMPGCFGRQHRFRGGRGRGQGWESGGRGQGGGRSGRC
jgi:predicted Fe-Mo cluster-binding NifX family protein